MIGVNRVFLSFACAIALLAGCSSAPDKELDLLRSTAPSSGMSRIVVYSPSRFIGAGDSLNVQVDGKTACYLKSGGYSVQEVAPFTHDMTFSYCGTRNLTHVTLTTLAGQTYYLRVMPYDSSITGILSGYPGEQVDKPDNNPLENTQDKMKKNTLPKKPGKLHNGPFEVKQIDAASALEAIAALTYIPGYR